MDIRSSVKVPLVIAAVLVVVRLLTEQADAPGSVNAVFGVAWLYFLVPLYLASRVASADAPKPYVALLKTTLVFVLLTRLMVWPTYAAAYAFSWEAPRFALESGGVVGDGVSPLMGYLLIPLRNAIIWTVAGTVFGMILGGVALAVMRRRAPASTASSSSSPGA